MTTETRAALTILIPKQIEELDPFAFTRSNAENSNVASSNCTETASQMGVITGGGDVIAAPDDTHRARSSMPNDVSVTSYRQMSENRPAAGDPDAEIHALFLQWIASQSRRRAHTQNLRVRG